MDHNEFVSALMIRKQQLYREFIQSDTSVFTMGTAMNPTSQTVLIMHIHPEDKSPGYYYYVINTNTTDRCKYHSYNKWNNFLINLVKLIKKNNACSFVIIKTNLNKQLIELNHDDIIIELLKNYHSTFITKWITENTFDDFKTVYDVPLQHVPILNNEEINL